MSNKEAVKKLIALLGGYKKTIVVIIGCLLISTALNLCIPLLNRRIMDDGFIGGDKEVLLAMVLGSLLIYLISSGIDLLKEKLYYGTVTRADITRITRRLGDEIGKVYGWDFPQRGRQAVSVER